MSTRQSTRLIVRVRGDLGSAAERVASMKATIVKRQPLINALVVAASTESAFRLRKESWVVSVEEDRKVAVQRRSKEGGHNARG